MARQRVAFDHARLVDLAEQATTSTNLQGVDLVCTYVQEEAKLSRRSNVTFQWHAKTQDHQTSEQVRVRVDNAYNQGIPLPTSWRTASRCISLDETANRSADAERFVAYPDLTCEILGMAKTVAVPSSDELAPGSVVALKSQRGERLDYLLCAHIESTRWLCHRGTFLEGRLNVDNPFDPADLVEKDIVRDAWSGCEKPLQVQEGQRKPTPGDSRASSTPTLPEKCKRKSQKADAVSARSSLSSAPQ